MSPSFLDPPPDYAPPADWVDPVTIPSFVREEIEVGDLLKKRAEADRAAMSDAEEFTTEARADDCEECRAKRQRAQLIGLGAGVILGVGLVAGVYWFVLRDGEHG